MEHDKISLFVYSSQVRVSQGHEPIGSEPRHDPTVLIQFGGKPSQRLILLRFCNMSILIAHQLFRGVALGQRVRAHSNF